MKGKEGFCDESLHILSKANLLLAAVDESFIVTKRDHKVRALPTFRYDEIALGKVLGTGGFGIVYEITNIKINRHDERFDDNNINIGNGEPDATDRNEQGSSREVKPPPEHGNCETEISRTTWQHNSTSSTRSISSSDVHNNLDYHYHYKIDKAKDLMEKCCCRTSSKVATSRYALKRLQKGLTTIERARGMLDLAVEAKYLSIVWHPNIIKIRGVAEGESVSDDFFIIIDRLCETLENRMNIWRKEIKKHQNKLSIFGPSNKCRKLLEQLLIDRLTVAYDLAAAFWYLHEHKLVYRDIKPANIGFDHRGMYYLLKRYCTYSGAHGSHHSVTFQPKGDVKVFDFGLCKNLSPSLKAHDGGYGYRLTGQAGSLPYMAPEVVLGKTYDSKCDVFSFAILLWEMLSLQGCCKGYTPEKFVDRVTIHQIRFPIKKSWPPLTRLMIPEAWDDDPKKRPDMKRVAILIRGDLNSMSTDDTVLHRTLHMIDRSHHEYIYDAKSMTTSSVDE